MSQLLTNERLFDSQEEAWAYARRWREEMWAYDGHAQVYQRGDQWVVATDRRDSCD